MHFTCLSQLLAMAACSISKASAMSSAGAHSNHKGPDIYRQEESKCNTPTILNDQQDDSDD